MRWRRFFLGDVIGTFGWSLFTAMLGYAGGTGLRGSFSEPPASWLRSRCWFLAGESGAPCGRSARSVRSGRLRTGNRERRPAPSGRTLRGSATTGSRALTDYLPGSGYLRSPLARITAEGEPRAGPSAPCWSHQPLLLLSMEKAFGRLLFRSPTAVKAVFSISMMWSISLASHTVGA